MIKKVSFKLAINLALSLLAILALFHILVLTQIIPYQLIWGSHLKNVQEMISFEGPSLVLTIMIILLLSLKAKYIKSKLSKHFLNIPIWILIGLFLLNTIGNLFSQSSIEMMIFTPITVLMDILLYRIVREKD